MLRIDVFLWQVRGQEQARSYDRIFVSALRNRALESRLARLRHTRWTIGFCLRSSTAAGMRNRVFRGKCVTAQLAAAQKSASLITRIGCTLREITRNSACRLARERLGFIAAFAGGWGGSLPTRAGLRRDDKIPFGNGGDWKEKKFAGTKPMTPFWVPQTSN